jgi:hypothetical protein
MGVVYYELLHLLAVGRTNISTRLSSAAPNAFVDKGTADDVNEWCAKRVGLFKFWGYFN